MQLFKVPEQGRYTSLKNEEYLKSILSKFSFDLIIFQDSYSPIHIPLINLSNEIDCPVIVFEHNCPDYSLLTLNEGFYSNKILSLKDFLRKLAYPYYKYKIKKREKERRQLLYQFCDKYILLSEQYVSIFLKLSKLKEDTGYKLDYINNPLTVDVYNKIDLNQKKKQLLFIGQLIPRKGMLKLLSIWNRLHQKYTDWEFVVVGDGEELSIIRDYIETNKVKRVNLVGYKTNVIPYLKDASIFCMASTHEGWPLVLFEAMSCGAIPIAYNSFASVYDILDHDINGMIVPAFNDKLYLKTLESLMNDADKRLKMGENAVKKAKKFKVNEIIDEWDILINEVAKAFER